MMSFEETARAAVVERLYVRLADPQQAQHYIEADYEVWTKALSAYPGFLGKEILQGREDPALLVSIIYWNSWEEWKSIPGKDLEAIQQRFELALGDVPHTFAEEPPLQSILRCGPCQAQSRPVEQRVFRVDPALTQRFVEQDAAIWTDFLRRQPGFVAKEVWLSQDVPGEVTTVTYWRSMQDWEGVPVQKLIERAQLFEQAMGAGSVTMTADYKENQRVCVSRVGVALDKED
ncbi:MAG: TIGR03792 family protein [Eubacteriales bacterium]|nr:TIGR03792 family protein [Eubacteriales bacterium]